MINSGTKNKNMEDLIKNDSAWKGGVFNVDEPMMIAMAKGTEKNTNLEHRQMTFREFAKFCSVAQEGAKHESYFVRSANFSITKGDPDSVDGAHNQFLAIDHYHRNKDTMNSPFDFLVGDIDGTKIKAELVAKAFHKMGLNFFLYTTHGQSAEVNKYRFVIPCRVSDGKYIQATNEKLIEDLRAAGVELEDSAVDWRAMGSKSNAWFMPTRDDPEDGLFYWDENMDGTQYMEVQKESVKGKEKGSGAKGNLAQGSKSLKEHISVILNGDDGLHFSVRDLTNYMILEGMKSGFVEDVILEIFDHVTNKDSRYDDRRDEVQGLIRGAVLRLNEKALVKLKRDPPPFPYHLLPKKLLEAVDEVTRVVRVPKEVACVVYMSMVMASMGMRITLHEKAHMDFYASVGFFCVMEPGELKTGLFKLLTKAHMNKLKAKHKQRWKIRAARVNTKNKGLKAKIKTEEENPPEIDSPEWIHHEDRIALLEAQIEEVPSKVPKMFIEDASEASMEQELLDNGGEIFVLSAEGRVVVDNILGKLSKGESIAAGVLLRGLTNDAISSSRQTRSGGEVDDSCLNILLLLQDDVYAKLIAHPEVFSNGLLGRILTIHPISLVGTRQEEKDEKPLDMEKLNGMDKVISMAFDCSGAHIRLNKAAYEIRRQFYNKIETLQAKGEIYENERDIVNKLCTLSVKVGSTFQFIATPIVMKDGEEMSLTAEWYEKGRDFIEYLNQLNIYAVRHSTDDSIIETAQHIMKIVKKDYRSVEFTLGRFKSKYLSGMKRIYADRAFDLLVDESIIKEISTANNTGRKFKMNFKGEE